MKAIKRILVPTDFSECSAEAAQVAGEIARRLEAEVQVVTVLETAALAADYGMVPDWPMMLAELRRDAAARLETFAREHFSGVKALSCQVREGSASREIVDAAEEAAADLIVMGTHGRGGLAHFLMGSVAEKVLRRSPVPLLTVRPQQAKAPVAAAAAPVPAAAEGSADKAEGSCSGKGQCRGRCNGRVTAADAIEAAVASGAAMF